MALAHRAPSTVERSPEESGVDLPERLVRYAELVGRENVLAGTDCGLGTRVGDPSICWAKFEAMAEGARRATKILWGRA